MNQENTQKLNGTNPSRSKAKVYIERSTSIVEFFISKAGYLALGSVIGLLEIDALWQSFNPHTTVEKVFVITLGILLWIGLESYGIEGTRKSKTVLELKIVKRNYILATIAILITMIIAPGALAGSEAIASDANAWEVFSSELLLTLSRTLVPVVGAGVSSFVGISYYASHWDKGRDLKMEDMKARYDAELMVKQKEIEIQELEKNGLRRVKKAKDKELVSQSVNGKGNTNGHSNGQVNIPIELEGLESLTDKEKLALTLYKSNEDATQEELAMLYGASRTAFTKALSRALEKVSDAT